QRAVSETQKAVSETQERVQKTAAQIEQTAAQIEQLKSSLSAQQVEAQQRLSALDARINDLQISGVELAKQRTLLVAVTELGDNIDSGRPFSRQLNAVESIIGGGTELSNLRVFAQQGLPTTDNLRSSFDEAARAALAGSKRDDAETAIDKFAANLSGLFSVRPTGDVEGDSPGAVIARADTHLTNGDVAAATQELSALEGSAAEAFKGWIAAAEARAIASRGLAALEERLSDNPNN
ncbi:MAG: mitofilin family membrane protein, partial [Pseudomonadota bacterium]